MKQKSDFEKWLEKNSKQYVIEDNVAYLDYVELNELKEAPFNILSDRELGKLLAEFFREDFDRSPCNSVEEMSQQFLIEWKKRQKE